MPFLGGSWDIVEVVRALATEVDSLQKISASHEARLQVLEGKQVTPAPAPVGAAILGGVEYADVTMGDLVANAAGAPGVDSSGVAVATPKLARAGKK